MLSRADLCCISTCFTINGTDKTLVCKLAICNITANCRKRGKEAYRGRIVSSRF